YHFSPFLSIITTIKYATTSPEEPFRSVLVLGRRGPNNSEFCREVNKVWQ
ncbi:hypothetical protein A2U01_0043510, partial [Trifolium medium]|nr:hypothetical protein [Trifolium medium]